MKHSKIIMSALMVITAVVILSVTGASSTDAANITASEVDQVCNALIEAENLGLSVGEYRADVCNTSQLSEEELQSQIDAFNAKADQYYAAESPMQGWKEENERLLREVYKESCSYRVDGGVLDYKISDVTFDETNTVSIVCMTMVGYNKWVDVSEDGGFEITCCANPVDITAKMVKEDGRWKFQESIDYTMTDSWIPQDMQNNEMGIATYAMSEEEQAEAAEAAELADAKYSTFEEAMAAAEQIHVEDICPLSAE